MAQNDGIIRFQGGVADQHLIPAYEGSVSLRGTTRSMVMIGSYLIEGDVRKRAPFSSNIKFYIEAPRAGSFDTAIRFVIENPETAAVSAIVGTVAVNVLSSLVWDGIKYCLNRVVGKDHSPDTQEMKVVTNQRGGDIEALIDAIEPSAREAHAAIGFGAGQIIVINGANNIVTLDEATKRYVSTTVRGESDDTKQVSVGMFNVNTKYGRVFDYQIGKTVPFKLHRNCESRTQGNLSTSLDRYARGAPNKDVTIRYIAESDLDGRVKRYIIFDAWFQQA